MHKSIQYRVLATVALLAAGIVLLNTVTRGERQMLRRPLVEFPMTFGEWRGSEAPLPSRIVAAAGVDDYINREYARPDGRRVQLYVGYYRSQRAGDTIHSPKNCLPGAGWEPVRISESTITTLSGATITANDYVIRKGADSQLVLYWYQARGRTISSEYAAKIWMAHGALIHRRTDAALVRIVTAVTGGEEQAKSQAIDFIRLIFPSLSEFIPD